MPGTIISTFSLVVIKTDKIFDPQSSWACMCCDSGRGTEKTNKQKQEISAVRKVLRDFNLQPNCQVGV